MWGFQSKRRGLREQLLLQAPEANPSEFVRRYLLQKSESTRSSTPARFDHRAHFALLAGTESLGHTVKKAH